jgi:hypothetical protein
MSRKHTPTTDPRNIVLSLDSSAIHARLAEIEGEAEALRLLLRAARARERVKEREDRHASQPEARRGR